MSGEETLELYVTLGVWGLTFLAAVKALGVQRALWGLALLVVVGLAIAFKTLGAITGGRRY